MQDTIIKGSGNSRSMKTVPNAPIIYPDFATFIQEFASTGIPFDLGPLNDAGLLTRGMDLNKANLLKDATAALYGKGDSASPDDIFAAIRPLITAATGAHFQYGNYSGANVYTKIYLSAPWSVLIIHSYKEWSSTTDGGVDGYLIIRPSANAATCYGMKLYENVPAGGIGPTCGIGNFSFAINGNNIEEIYGKNGYLYRYVAIG